MGLPSTAVAPLPFTFGCVAPVLGAPEWMAQKYLTITFNFQHNILVGSFLTVCFVVQPCTSLTLQLPLILSFVPLVSLRHLLNVSESSIWILVLPSSNHGLKLSISGGFFCDSSRHWIG